MTAQAKSHDTLVGTQFGSRAAAYLTSAVHARGEDLDALAALVRARPTARVLDLGCGGGHVVFAAAPHVREVVAYDLSPEMLDVVARAAQDRGLANVTTQISPGTPLLDTWYQAIELLRDPSHVRSYSRPEWEEALARAGFASRATSRHRVRLVFDVWIERMQTPRVQADAIRALQARMSEGVARYFAVEADGTFQIELGVFEAGKLGA